MFRYCLEVYLEHNMIFNMEFKTITSVAKVIDRFNVIDGMWFDLYDCIKGKDIDVPSLMRIWHA